MGALLSHLWTIETLTKWLGFLHRRSSWDHWRVACRLVRGSSGVVFSHSQISFCSPKAIRWRELWRWMSTAAILYRKYCDIHARSNLSIIETNQSADYLTMHSKPVAAPLSLKKLCVTASQQFCLFQNIDNADTLGQRHRGRSDLLWGVT